MFGGFGTRANAAQFSDVPATHGFYQEIQYLLDKGVINPTSKFGVDEKVTRAEVAVMVSKAVGLNGTKRATKFKDVSASHNASGYIDSAVKAGIITGYSDGTFRPNEYVNRGQMAIFLARGFKLSIESTTNFKDVTPSMASYSSVKKIIQAGITTGYSDKTFRPTQTLTRGQISAFVARGMGFKKVVAKQMQVHFIDVGQGDSILIKSPNGKTMLIDGGAKSAGDEVVSFIKSKGITSLDYVVATHPDADHIGGLISVLQNFKVGQFIDSGKVHTTQTYYDLLTLIDQKNIPFKVASTGDLIGLDNAINTKVLNANNNASNNNDASVVIKLVYGSVSFLFTGDAETKTEAEIVSKYGTGLKSTYLKAGHHGANTSSSAAFINAVKPTGTILSYGKDNSYGHPNTDVVNRLKAVNSKIYSTAQSGNITVTTNGSTHSVSVKPWTNTVTPKPEPAPKPQPDPGSGTYVIPGAPTSFANCTEMNKYYPNGVKQGHPAYASKHDRDKDGWSCE